MSSEEKMQQIFCEVLSIVPEQFCEELEYNTISAWDSVGHMKLVAELEDGFDIMMDTEDIIDLSSYSKAREILKKYGVEF